LLLILTMLCSCFSLAGTFEKMELEKKTDYVWYQFTGTIEKSDLEVFKNLAEKHGNKLFMVITSAGGDFITGLSLGVVTIDKKVNVCVNKAYSAAGIWALGDKTRVYLDEKSELGIHLPYSVKPESKPELWMNLGCIYRDYLEIIFDLTIARDLMREMTDLRANYATDSMIVYTKAGKSVRKIEKPKPTETK
jgi:hypothetical protein